MSGSGTPTCTTRAGEVAGVERLLEHLGAADGLDAHVGAVAVGEGADRLDRIGLDASRRCGWRRTPAPTRASRGSRSTAMIVLRAREPGARDGGVARRRRSRTPRRVSPRPTSPVYMAAPEAGHHAAARAGRRPRAAPRGRPSWPGRRRRASSRRTRRCRARARAPCRRRASSSASRCAWRSSTTAGRAGTPGTSPHTARQLRTTKSPGATLGDVRRRPTSTTPAASWPRRNGKSSLIAPSR